MKFITLAICIVIASAGTDGVIRAQGIAVPASNSIAAESSDRAQDGLNGPVRRLRVESAKILSKDGKAIESPRVLRELSTYDPKGGKIDSVAYPVDGTTLPGKENYKYDQKGNVIEMVLSADDGSILSKEKYDYEFDEFGNWKKMTSEVAVYENGNLSYEPIEVTYRTITYYYSQAVASVAAGLAVASDSNVVSHVKDKGLTKTAISSSKEPRTTNVEQPKAATTDEKKADTSEETAVAAKKEIPDEASTLVTPKTEVPKLPVVHVSEEALRKAAIELPQPEYPAQAIMAGVGGKVEVQFIIDEKGAVTTVNPISGSPMLTEAAVNAGRKARFSATSLSSQPANVFGVITYDFALPRPEATPNVSASAEIGKPAPLDERAPPEVKPSPAPIADAKVAKSIKEIPSPPAKGSASSGGSVLKSPIVPSPASLSYGTAFEKGMASLASAKYAEAAEFFRQVVRTDPTDALAYSKLGVSYSALNEHKEAIGAFKQAIRLKRAFVDFDSYYRLGSAYISLGDYKAAVDPLKQSLYGLRAQVMDPKPRKPAPGTPSQLDIHYALGLAYHGSGSFRDAVKEFENAVSLKPDFASAHYGLGLSYFELGDTRSAKKEEAILLKMKSPLANKLTGLLLVPAARKNRVF